MKICKAASLTALVAFGATHHASGAPVRSESALRGNVGLKPDEPAKHAWAVPSTSQLNSNGTQAAYPGNEPAEWDWNRYGKLSQQDVDSWKLKDKSDSESQSLDAAAMNVSTFVASNANATQQPARYAGCTVIPNQACTVNVQQVSQDLVGRIVLFLGCSLDIYALNYFCKSAGAPVVGFTRNPGNEVYGKENFAYCNVGGFILAYSFHPGSSGPPYFEACEKVLHGRCSTISSEQLHRDSIARVVHTFGMPPSAIIVDSSLWDAANWWGQAGKPAEPYLVDPTRLAHWCTVELPHLINTVQLISPTSKVGFRTAPRVEPAFGYGHSMHNIDGMNLCYRTQAFSNLMAYHLIDYNLIVDMFLTAQGVPGHPKEFYEDPFHPGVLPSVLYVDSVLQWMHSVVR